MRYAIWLWPKRLIFMEQNVQLDFSYTFACFFLLLVFVLTWHLCAFSWYKRKVKYPSKSCFFHKLYTNTFHYDAMFAHIPLLPSSRGWWLAHSMNRYKYILYNWCVYAQSESDIQRPSTYSVIDRNGKYVFFNYYCLFESHSCVSST